MLRFAPAKYSRRLFYDMTVFIHTPLGRCGFTSPLSFSTRGDDPPSFNDADDLLGPVRGRFIEQQGNSRSIIINARQ